jgi:hypothetical protein
MMTLEEVQSSFNMEFTLTTRPSVTSMTEIRPQRQQIHRRSRMSAHRRCMCSKLATAVSSAVTGLSAHSS